ncbi:MAG: hypothetical protein WBD22_02905 [Pyrinomonadaceae bacterium]
MNCQDFRTELAIYSDAKAASVDDIDVDRHLSKCPLCRERLDEFRMLRTDLRSMARKEVPTWVLDSVRTRVAESSYISEAIDLVPLSKKRPNWLRLWLLPSGAGALCSLIAAFSLIRLLSAGADVMERPMAFPPSRSTPMATTRSSGVRATQVPTAAEFALSRKSVGGESPSVNPSGALISLTESFIGRNPSSDEVVVIADVYRNGSAEIAEVVEPSDDRKTVDELAKALNFNAAHAPFVTADLDQRSETIRVVLRIQSVDVNIRESTRRRRTL